MKEEPPALKEFMISVKEELVTKLGEGDHLKMKTWVAIEIALNCARKGWDYGRDRKDYEDHNSI